MPHDLSVLKEDPVDKKEIVLIASRAISLYLVF